MRFRVEEPATKGAGTSHVEAHHVNLVDGHLVFMQEAGRNSDVLEIWAPGTWAHVKALLETMATAGSASPVVVTHYTRAEGGLWYVWPPEAKQPELALLETPLDLTLGGSPRYVLLSGLTVHALRLSDGRVWDVVNRYRPVGMNLSDAEMARRCRP